MVIHYHYSVFENSGEIRRIKNINKDGAFSLSDNVIEVVFFSVKHLPRILHGNVFKLNDRVSQKLYVPTIPSASRNIVLEYLDSIWTSFVLLVLSLIYKPTYIIGEYSLASKSMKLCKKVLSRVKFIVDVHGAVPEEYEYNVENPKPWLLKMLTEYEQLSIDWASLVICQSDEMKRHLSHKYKCNLDKICVYRCGVDTNLFCMDLSKRELIRKELGVADEDVVFVYSGGLHKWQKIDESIQFFQQYYMGNPNSYMLILTQEQSKLKSVLSKFGEDISSRVIARSLSFDKVPDFLNVADYAFLMRDDTLMNAVAYPTKLGEYFACGLPVVTTQVAKKWVAEDAFDFFIFSDSTKFLFAPKNDIRDSIRNYAICNLSLDIDYLNLQKYLGDLNN